MNIKLHTPKSLKTGSGMASMKQFLLSLFATSISIALTFGTAAIIDYHAKQKSKRQIVMMVMYDMYNSLQSIEKADSSILQSMEFQRQIAEDTTQYKKLLPYLASQTPIVDYTETTEHIFSTSIETINTVGNVLFTENVAEFYQTRHAYKTMACDSIINERARKMSLSTAKGTLDFDYSTYALVSGGILNTMHRLYAQCKQMMEVTDEEIDAYRKERELINKDVPESDVTLDSLLNRVMPLQESINEAKAKLKLE